MARPTRHPGRRMALLPAALLATILSLFAVGQTLAQSATTTASGQAPGAGVTTIASLTPPMLPESVTVDAAGNVYSAWLPTGEVIKIASSGARTTLATMNLGQGGVVLGVALEPSGALLVAARAAGAPGTDTFGVWRIQPDDTKQLAAAFPSAVGMNDILPIPGGGFYVTDSTAGAIYRVTPTGVVEKWLDHDLLKPNQQACSPGHPLPFGANGLTFAPDGSLLVANTDTATIVRVPVNADASAGTPTPWAGPDCARLLGADGITADGRGGVYVAVGLLNMVVQVAPGGAVRTLATAADGLDTPTSVKRGAGPYAGSLLIANGALSAAQPVLAPYRPGPEPRPSILVIGPTRLAGLPLAFPRTGSPTSPTSPTTATSATSAAAPATLTLPTLAAGAALLLLAFLGAGFTLVGRSRSPAA